ncbi:MAG TPA: FecR family protein [bacterium]|nr:FecR family protein [bacterium]
MRRIVLIALALLLPLSAMAETSRDFSRKLPAGYVLDKVKGTVLVLPSGSAVTETAEEDQTVQPGDEVITKDDSEVSLTLNDQTMVKLSADSEVKVSDLTRKESNGFVSRLRLAAGSVLALVEKLQATHSVFEIESGGVVCGVRGTAFEVQKDSGLVQTSTFEGEVQMKKDGQTQAVSADHHSDFALDKGRFLRQRLLSEREKARYGNWRRYSELAARREKERQEALKAFNSLPSSEQDQLWSGLRKVRDRDQFKILRRMMREKNHQDRLRVMDNALQARVSAQREREETMRKAREEREKSLKILREKRK